MKKLIKISLIAITLSGCASHDLILKKEAFTPLKQYSKVSKVVRAESSVHINKFIDKRKDKGPIGSALTGFFAKPTPIEFEKSLESYVLDEMNTGLRERGVSVSSVTGGDFDLNGEIQEFSIEETTVGLGPQEAKCSVKLELSLWDNRKEVMRWKGSFYVNLTSGGKVMDGGEKFAPTIASCMNEILEQVINKKKFQEVLGIAL